MSQYLSHLANLAFNPVDVVQPRLASRFENQVDPLAPTLMAQEIQQDAQTIQPRQEHQEPTQHDPLRQASQPRLQPVIENIYPTEIRIQEAPALKSPPNQTQTAIAQTLPVTRPVTVPVAPALMSTNTIIEHHIERIRTVTPHATGLQEGINLPKKQTPAVAISAPPVPLVEIEERIEPKTSENRDEARDPVKPASIRVQPVQIERLTVATTTYPDLPRAEVEVDVAPTPTIQVTIGRIEIRASQTSSPTPTKPRASSGMSLDDYLKQRNGGKP